MSARPTGAQILALAREHIGEPYIFGAFAAKDNAAYGGPWDCAEFASWLVYQTAGVLYGVRDAGERPSLADAYTGYWLRDARKIGTLVTIDEATRTPGAFLLRSPVERRGHVAVSDGMGGTVEAHSRASGVCARQVAGRVWTCGVLPPGIDYTPASGLTGGDHG